MAGGKGNCIVCLTNSLVACNDKIESSKTKQSKKQNLKKQNPKPPTQFLAWVKCRDWYRSACPSMVTQIFKQHQVSVNLLRIHKFCVFTCPECVLIWGWQFNLWPEICFKILPRLCKHRKLTSSEEIFLEEIFLEESFRRNMLNLRPNNFQGLNLLFVCYDVVVFSSGTTKACKILFYAK